MDPLFTRAESGGHCNSTVVYGHSGSPNDAMRLYFFRYTVFWYHCTHFIRRLDGHSLVSLWKFWRELIVIADVDLLVAYRHYGPFSMVFYRHCRQYSLVVYVIADISFLDGL